MRLLKSILNGEALNFADCAVNCTSSEQMGQRRVEARAAELIAEEMSLRELRRARQLTQVRVARTLGITQDSVSRLEQRSDLLLSTLRKTIRRWAAISRWSPNFPTSRRWCCPV
jgi:DNA-binding transcriptional regulator YiaG